MSYIAAAWLWASHVTSTRLGFLISKINFWSQHEGNIQGSVPHEQRSQWVVAGPQWTPQAMLHHLKNVHHALFYKFEFSGWVTLFKRLKTKWGLPVLWVTTSSKNKAVWTRSGTLSLGLEGSSSWPTASHLVTLSWLGMRQGTSPQTILWKNKLSVLCVGNKNHIRCGATSWHLNFVLPVPCPLTMCFSKWKFNCCIKFPNATFAKQKRQSKQKLLRLKGINPKTKEWIMMFSRNNETWVFRTRNAIITDVSEMCR